MSKTRFIEPILLIAFGLACGATTFWVIATQGPARASDGMIVTGSTVPGHSAIILNATPKLDYFLVIGGPEHPVLQLKPGGCLKGPLTVRSEDGKVLFSLNATSMIPAGCAK